MTAPLAPGIYDAIPPETYHADALCDVPTLSRSGIVTLLNSSPAEYAALNPRLSQWPVIERDGTDATDLGELVHAIVLGVGCNYVVKSPSDFTAPKTNKPYSTWSGEAKLWRDEQRAAGNVVIDYETNALAVEISARLLDALRAKFPDWDEGRSEVTALWDRRLDDGSVIKCRARIDRLLPSAIVDVKTSALSLSDAELGKAIGLKGLDVQHIWYQQGVGAALSATNDPMRAYADDECLPFIFAYVRTVPPYTIRFVDLAAKWPLGLTRQRIDKAAHIFGECVRTGTWPDELIECAPEPPDWLSNRWMMSALMDDGVDE
jgi:hypothetical protein